MNPKIQKLRADQKKDAAKIEMLQRRMKDRAAQLTAMENTDIIGLIRDVGMSVDELFELMRKVKKEEIPAPCIDPDNDPESTSDEMEEIEDE